MLELLVLVLLVAVGLNLFMTLRIARIVREAPEPQDLPFTVDLDSPAPSFMATRLATGAALASDALAGAPTVIVFLSAGCGDCRKKLPELAQMLPGIRRAGVQLLVVGMESERKVREFLAATPLFEHVVMLDKKAKKLINPRNASPFYLFIDDQGIVRASHFIGDRNWQTFAGQMHEYIVAPTDGVTNGA